MTCKDCIVKDLIKDSKIIAGKRTVMGAFFSNATTHELGTESRLMSAFHDVFICIRDPFCQPIGAWQNPCLDEERSRDVCVRAWGQQYWSRHEYGSRVAWLVMWRTDRIPADYFVWKPSSQVSGRISHKWACSFNLRKQAEIGKKDEKTSW